MFKKKVILIILGSLLLLTGCSNYMASLYDNNEKIASNTNSYTIVGIEQEIDNDKFSGKVKKLEGMDTIWTYDADEDITIDMIYKLDVKKGKVKLVLISPDKTVTDLIEISEDGDIKDYCTNKVYIKQGENRIKMVAGKDTSLEFDIQISKGEFDGLGNMD